jgi:hypothetical protein
MDEIFTISVCNFHTKLFHVSVIKYFSSYRDSLKSRFQWTYSLLIWKVMNFFQLTEPFRANWALGLTQPLTEMSIGRWKIIFLGSRARPVRRADNLAAICEPIIYEMWNPHHLTTPGPPTGISSFEELSCSVEVTPKKAVTWNVTSCSTVAVRRSFGGIYYLQLQGRRLNQAKCQKRNKQWAEFGGYVLCSLFVSSWAIIGLSKWILFCTWKKSCPCTYTIKY